MASFLHAHHPSVAAGVLLAASVLHIAGFHKLRSLSTSRLVDWVGFNNFTALFTLSSWKNSMLYTSVEYHLDHLLQVTTFALGLFFAVILRIKIQQELLPHHIDTPVGHSRLCVASGFTDSLTSRTSQPNFSSSDCRR